MWQGPGWWLASDGKWYPADAKPGDVYEGTIDEAAAPEITTSTATLPTTAAPEISPETPAVWDIAPAEPIEPDVPLVPETPPTPEPAPVVTREVPPIPATPQPTFEVPAAEPTSPPATPGPGWQAIVDTEPAPATIEPIETPEPPSAEAVAPTPIPDLDPPAVETPLVTTAAPAEAAIPVVEPPIPTVAIPLETDNTSISLPPGAAVPEVPPPLTTPVADDDGWTSAYEERNDTTLAPTEPPLGVSAIDPIAEPITAPLDLSNVTAPQDAAPIARDDAWRKPGTAAAPLATTTLDGPGRSSPERASAPEVVDLAIPETSPLLEEAAPAPKRSNNLIRALLALAVIVGLALLIAWVLRPGAEEDPLATEEDATTVTTSSTLAPTTTTNDSLVSVFELRQGDCIIGDIGAGEVTQVEMVDCAEEHSFEVYREGLVDSSITTYDEAAIAAYAEDICRTSLAAYIPADDDRDLKFKFLQPTAESWGNANDPDRVVTCLLYDEDAPLVGRAGS